MSLFMLHADQFRIDDGDVVKGELLALLIGERCPAMGEDRQVAGKVPDQLRQVNCHIAIGKDSRFATLELVTVTIGTMHHRNAPTGIEAGYGRYLIGDARGDHELFCFERLSRFRLDRKSVFGLSTGRRQVIAKFYRII